MAGQFHEGGIELGQALRVVEAVREAARSGIADSPAGFMPSARDWARYVLEDVGLSWYPRNPLELMLPGAVGAKSDLAIDKSQTLEMVIAELGELLLLGIKVPLKGDFDEAKQDAAAHLFALLLDIRRRMWQDHGKPESAPATGAGPDLGRSPSPAGYRVVDRLGLQAGH